VNEKARKRLYLLLNAPDRRLTGQKPLVLGPFRIVQFTTDGIWASANLLSPTHLATVNQAGRYVLEDSSEWDSGRVLSPSKWIGDEQLAEL
jgi:hypothetical protein